MRSELIVESKWPFVSTTSWSAFDGHSRGEFLLVDPLQWQNSCANNSLSVRLTCDCTPRYIIDEVYIDSQKKMAICVNSIMVGLLWPPQGEFLLVNPMQWQKPCANNALFTCSCLILDKNYTGMNIPGFSVWVMSSSVESAFILYVHLYTHTCVRMNLVRAFVHTYVCPYESCTCICTHIRVFVCTIVTTSNGSN